MTATRSGWRASNVLFLIVALLVPPLAILLLVGRPEPRRSPKRPVLTPIG